MFYGFLNLVLRSNRIVHQDWLDGNGCILSWGRHVAVEIDPFRRDPFDRSSSRRGVRLTAALYHPLSRCHASRGIVGSAPSSCSTSSPSVSTLFILSPFRLTRGCSDQPLNPCLVSCRILSRGESLVNKYPRVLRYSPVLLPLPCMWFRNVPP